MKGAPCSVCGTVKYRKAGGALICINGHENMTFREEMADEDNLLNITKRSLKIKKEKIKVDLPQDTQPQTLSKLICLELFQHYLKECCQSLIQRQIVLPDMLHTVKQFWLKWIEKVNFEEAEFKMTVNYMNFQDYHVPHVLLAEYSLCLIYISCVWLRYPIHLMDCLRWIHADVIPYLNPAVNLPSYLKSYVDYANEAKHSYWFNVSNIPSLAVLRVVCKRMMGFYQMEYGIECPPPNRMLIWKRCVHELHVSESALIFMDSLHQIWHGIHTKDIEFSYSVKGTGFPFELIMSKYFACTLVSFKLIYGLNGDSFMHDQSVRADSESDWPRQLDMPTWSSLLDRLKAIAESMLYPTTLLPGEFKSFDQFETYWSKYLVPQEHPRLSSILDAFKQLIKKERVQDSSMRDCPIHSPPETRPLPSPDTSLPPPLPGQHYIHYEYRKDPIGDFHPDYHILIHYLSQWSGISIPNLQREVEHLEKFLIELRSTVNE